MWRDAGMQVEAWRDAGGERGRGRCGSGRVEGGR